MPPKIRMVRVLSKVQSKRLLGWGEDIFDGVRYGLKWRSATWHCVLYDGRFPVTHVGLLTHKVEVADKKIAVGGIGGVVTVPSYQRKGYAQLAMTAAHDHMTKRLKVSYGFLFCPEQLTSFYSDLGWKRLRRPVYVRQRGGEIKMPLPAMTLNLSTADWPKGKIVLKSKPW